MLRIVSLLLSVVVLAAAPAVAGDARQAFTDPEKAGPDFAAQGEYVGTLQPGEDMKLGVQVIALGDGKFDAVAYPGGLPGDGWNGEEKIKGHGEMVEGVVKFTVPDNRGSGVLKDGVITVSDDNGIVMGRLEKVCRKSPTLGAKSPEGAVVLFDGTSADNFEGGRMTEDGLLMEGATSKQKFQSFKIHLEFRTPFQPYARGQGRGNSGFYAQGRHEVQILDSFGLEGESNECGGIYGVSKPKVNMCLPPLSWQTYDVDFTAAEFRDGKLVKNARMTVRHNGVLVQDNVEVPSTTTAAPVSDQSAAPGPVFLQNHGNPVRFRNIWVVPKE
jgi:hypothetical protein